MRPFVLAFVLGTFLLQQESQLPTLRVALVGAALLLTLSLLPTRHRVVRIVGLVIAGGLLGYGIAAWRAEICLADALPPELEGQDVEIVGVVASLPQITEKGVRFMFHREQGEQVPEGISLSWYRERAKGVEEIALPKLVAGQRWRLTVRLKRPRGLSNPHAFDFEPWALERGIRATGYVRTKGGTQMLAPQVEGWPYTLHRWRGEIREAMKSHLRDARLAGVLVALAVGDQDSIAPPDWDVFWKTGVGHLMSISGLHITMLAALAYSAAFWLWVRVPPLALRIPARKAALVVGVIAALAYTLLTGYQVPAQRTFCMLAVVAFCVLCDRHGSMSRVLALAALVVILMDPWSVLAAGFWLSFGAVAAIFYAMALRAGNAGKVHLAIREQLAVTLAMLPMLVALFQEVSLVSPLANAFAIPLVSLIVVPLTLGGAFLPLPALLDVAHALMLLVMQALGWLAQWPNAMVETHAPAAWTVLAATLGCAWLLAPRGVPLRSLGLVWIAPMFLVGPAKPLHGQAWVDVLDVGSGLAVVVRTATHALAYDAGPSWNADADSGGRIVVPFLRGEGVRQLSGLIISHADDDHAGGALSVAVSRRPQWMLSSLDSAYPVHWIVEESRRCLAGEKWDWDGVAFEILHPGEAAYDRSGKRKENDRSCVLRVAAKGGSVLLTGDVEARGEAEMLARDRSALSADILVVPHHGSKTSSTPAFLAQVAPTTGLVSVGYRNRFRHPAEAVVARYAERGIPLRRTDMEGALQVVLPSDTSKQVTVTPHARQVRYWSDRRLP